MCKWEWKKLGDVCDIKCGATPLKSDKSFWENGSIPWFTVDDIRNQGRLIKETQKRVTEKALNKLTLFPKDTVLLCCTASVGEYALTEIPLTCNQQFNGLVIKKTNILYSKYLFHFASTLKEQLLGLSGKTTIDFISNSKVRQIVIPIPPLSEQKRIVKNLDEKFAKIDKLKTTAEINLKNAKEIFNAELEKVYIEKNTWGKAKLEELVSSDCSLGYGIVQPGDEFPNGVPVVRPVDLTAKYVTKQNLKHVNPKISDGYKRTILKGGEILFCVRGTTGVVSIASEELNGCNVTRGISPLRFDVLETALYMYYCFQTKKVSEEIQLKTKGTALKQINISDLRNLLIPLPPLSEQKRIVAHLDKLSEKVKRLEENYTRTIADCEELKKSILKQTFQGEN